MGGEAVLALEPAHDRIERRGGKEDHRATSFADGVVVRVVDQVVGRDLTVAEAGAHDEAGGLEHVEGPVDGRQADVGVVVLDRAGELLRGEVLVVRVDESPQHRPTSRGHPLAAGAEALDQVVDV